MGDRSSPELEGEDGVRKSGPSRHTSHHPKVAPPEVGKSAKKRNISGSQNDIQYTDAVIIGNGPSGISLSFFLSGHLPYLTPDTSHSNEYLQLRLQTCDQDTSLVDMDLEYMCNGLEGRSNNPMALLVDNLTHPDADVGLEKASLLRWEHHTDRVVPHVVLGQTAEGGAWQMMEGEMQTLSLGNWMQLPDLPFKEWLENYRSEQRDGQREHYLPPVRNRASMQEVCAYYSHYVHHHKLDQYFHNYSTVTSVERVLDVSHSVDSESGEQHPCSRDHSGMVKWEVRGSHVECGDDGQTHTTDFCYRAPSVVLATGTFDLPNKLGIPGESEPYVLHSLVELEQIINQGSLTQNSDPIMVVGAGLSAADAILCLQNAELPLLHVFRRDVKDPRVVLRQLPRPLYPEYHNVLELMQGTQQDPSYEALPQHHLVECLPKGKVLVRGRSTTEADSLVQVSYVVVLIGSRPNLSFLPQNGKNLGIIPGLDIEPKANPFHMNPYTYQSVYECGLYAMGPLVGDNFVRFLRGGALGISSHLWRKKEGKL